MQNKKKTNKNQPVRFHNYTNATWAIFQLYHGENNFYFKFQWDYMHNVNFVQDQHAQLENARSRKQQSTGKHIVPLGQIIRIQSQPSCVHTSSRCLLIRITNSKYPNYDLWFDPTKVKVRTRDQPNSRQAH
jgi:hypothetical protein